MSGLEFDSSRQDARALAENRVFRAVSDMGRRHMLDLIRQNPGISMTTLCEFFPLSRFAVMKHLNLLDEAGLLQKKQQGRVKKLYVNAAPLERALAPWLVRFQPFQAKRQE